MRQETERLLDALSKQFQEKRAYKINGRIPKVNHRAFIEAVADGKKLATAMKDAGAGGSSERAMQVEGSKLLKSHPEYRVAILDLVESKKRMVLNAMTQQKMDNAGLSALAMTFGILTDKGELLAGRPTFRAVSDVDLTAISGDKGKLLAFVLGRLSASQKRLPLAKVH